MQVGVPAGAMWSVNLVLLQLCHDLIVGTDYFFLLFTLPLFPFCLTPLFSIWTIHCDASTLTHAVR